MDRVGVAVVGAGQAGLAVSHELTGVGVEHVVLERGRVGQRWRDRWESFCLVTPNWSVQLPGGRYEGADPDGYLPRDGIVAHLEGYAASFAAPVREGVEVSWLGPAPDGGFLLRSPPGRVLVVGSGQSGAQIVEELHEAGHEVVLACGRAPWAPRRLGGRDIFWWAMETGFMDAPVGALPTPGARLFANVLASGQYSAQVAVGMGLRRASRAAA